MAIGYPRQFILELQRRTSSMCQVMLAVVADSSGWAVPAGHVLVDRLD